MSDERARRLVSDNSNERCEKSLFQRPTKLICCGVSAEGTNSLPTAAILLPADFFSAKEHGFKQVRNFAPDRLTEFFGMIGGDWR